MLLIILIIVMFYGFCTDNYTPLKTFGKIVAWIYGIIFVICLIILIITIINDAAAENAYREQVKKTPLIEWACDVNGYKLHLVERPSNVYQCSTGKEIAHDSDDGYRCNELDIKVNHWQYCKPKVNTKRSKFNYLRGN